MTNNRTKREPMPGTVVPAGRAGSALAMASPLLWPSQECLQHSRLTKRITGSRKSPTSANRNRDPFANRPGAPTKLKEKE
jgi:hypothetical protein